MPTLSQLRYLVEVARRGHFGRAAQACHVSQPTLSSQIAKAEEELGVVILDRQAKPIVATENGRALIEQATEVLLAHDNLVALAQRKQESLSGDFHLGIIPTVSPYLLPRFLAAFAHRYPLVQLSVLELTTDEIVQRIKEQKLDAAILATPLLESAIAEKILFYDPFYLYAHPEEPLLAEAVLDVHKLNPKKLWLLSDGHCFRNQVVNYCDIRQTHTHFGSVRFVAGTIETLRNLINSAGGYTLVPEIFVQTLSSSTRKAQVRPFGKPLPTREIALVHHKRTAKRAIVEALFVEIEQTLPVGVQRAADDSLVLSIS